MIKYIEPAEEFKEVMTPLSSLSICLVDDMMSSSLANFPTNHTIVILFPHFLPATLTLRFAAIFHMSSAGTDSDNCVESG